MCKTLILAAMIVASTTSAFADCTVKGKIEGGVVNVRTLPSTQGEIIGDLNDGDGITIETIKPVNGFFWISAPQDNNRTLSGWLKKSLIACVE